MLHGANTKSYHADAPETALHTQRGHEDSSDDQSQSKDDANHQQQKERYSAISPPAGVTAAGIKLANLIQDNEAECYQAKDQKGDSNDEYQHPHNIH
ncbi:MAG: hypothetical protein ACYDAG_10200 [Chloroflexota bacterium]